MTPPKKSQGEKRRPSKPSQAKPPRRKRDRSPAKKRASPVMIAAIAVVVVAGVAAVAASTIARRSEESGIAETRPVSVEGTSLPQMPADPSQADPAVGMTIPAVTGASFDGSPVAIAPGGKAKVVIFLAHWCPHCRAEVPRLVSWMRENPIPEEVEIVSVSTAVRSGATNYPPSRWLEREGWTLPVLVDDKRSNAGGAFGVQGYPTFVAISADGKVLGRVAGEITTEQWVRMLSGVAGTARLSEG